MREYILAKSVASHTFTVHAEESRKEAAVRRMLDHIGGNTEGASFHELNRLSPTVLIKRDGQLVGYYTEESAWAKLQIKPTGLSGVTAIVFGQRVGQIPNTFTIKEPGEIAVWISAYIEHTETETRYGVFIPTAKEAGFERRKEKTEFGSAYGDTFGLRFYAGDKLVLEPPGHLEIESTITPGGIRNKKLHELTQAKIAALSAETVRSRKNRPKQSATETEPTPEGLKNAEWESSDHSK